MNVFVCLNISAPYGFLWFLMVSYGVLSPLVLALLYVNPLLRANHVVPRADVVRGHCNQACDLGHGLRQFGGLFLTT